MQSVSEHLKGDGGLSDAQARQTGIAERLSRLIAELEKAASAPQPSSSPTLASPQSPARQEQKLSEQSAADQESQQDDSSLSPEDLKADKWGHLPERWQRQMASGAAEQFLPEYQDLIEAYYRRLAETPAP
jgi:hypothetical protein